MTVADTPEGIYDLLTRLEPGDEVVWKDEQYGKMRTRPSVVTEVMPYSEYGGSVKVEYKGPGGGTTLSYDYKPNMVEKGFWSSPYKVDEVKGSKNSEIQKLKVVKWA